MKFNLLLMDSGQQRYSQPKQEFCGLKYALKQEIYLLRRYRNFIVETDIKYLAGILNNSEKMPNATINCWVDYIRMNFIFEIIYKKEKTFGPDRLSRRNSTLETLLQIDLRIVQIIRKKIYKSCQEKTKRRYLLSWKSFMRTLT